MSVMNITFLEKGEWFFDGPEWLPDATITLGVTTRMMTSGRPGVLIKIETNHNTIVVDTTARLFVTMAKMIEARYPDLMED
jgi:hypothetical protein